MPRSALRYFVQRAMRSDALRWPITFMLRGVDDPIAVRHEAEYVAQLSRDAGEGGFIDHFLKDEWRRLSDELGRRMSIESSNDCSTSRLINATTSTCVSKPSHSGR